MTTPEQAMSDSQIQRWLQVAVTLAERLNGKVA